MANSRVQLEVEDWVRREWMPKKFEQKFHIKPQPVRLSCGGVFNFDAVSEDHKTVATISTSGPRTKGGKNAIGNFRKIRSDMFFLLLLPSVQRRIVVLTQSDMFEWCKKEFEGGRVPDCIEFVHAQLPESLAMKLRSARRAASKEMSPK